MELVDRKVGNNEPELNRITIKKEIAGSSNLSLCEILNKATREALTASQWWSQREARLSPVATECDKVLGERASSRLDQQTRTNATSTQGTSS